MSVEIVFEPELAVEDAKAVLAPLRAYNRAKTGFHGPSYEFGFLLRDENGATRGGLTGHLGYSWMFVELLFVPEEWRGQDLGRRLMARAEAFAREQGATGIWLDTFSFQARGFYEKLGFAVIGQIDDYPPGESRYFLKKLL